MKKVRGPFCDLSGEYKNEPDTVKSLVWTKVNKEGHPLIDFTSEVFMAKEANIGPYKLNFRQIANIGEYETIDLTDAIVSQLA